MVARPDGDCGSVEHLGDIVGVYARQVERDDPAAQVGIHRAVELDSRHGPRQHIQRVGDQLALMRADRVHPQVAEILRRDSEPDRVADRGGSSFELPWNVVEVAPPQVDLADHLAAGEERRHRLEELPARPERPRA